MSVMEKVAEFGKMKKKDLTELKKVIEEKQMDLDVEKDGIMAELVAQRGTVLNLLDGDNQKILDKENKKLEILEKLYRDKVSEFKENLEVLKAIEQIFKIREEKKSSARSRLYGLCGVLISITGIGLAYGSDTFGTLINKKTLDEARASIMRFIPRM